MKHHHQAHLVVVLWVIIMVFPSSQSFAISLLRAHVRRTGHAPVRFVRAVSSSSSSTTTQLLDGAPPKPRNGSRKKSPSSSTTLEKEKTLEWERFEFGETPKWDSRFEIDRTAIAANEETLESLHREDAIKDKESSRALNQKQDTWEQLDPETVERATRALLPFCQADRVQRIHTVLQQRTGQTQFLFENPSNPSNVWACLRTMDSFGIQHVHVVVQSDQYDRASKMALVQKRGMRTAMGSAQWLSLRNHDSTRQAVQYLKRNNNNNNNDDSDDCLILASDTSPTSQDIRHIDWERLMGENKKRKIVIVMGNEERGISDEMRTLADATFTLPMVGFAESFNLSVATAITLAHLSAASSRCPLRPGDLPRHEYNYLLLRGLINTVSQKRLIPAVFRKEGIDFPKCLL